MLGFEFNVSDKLRSFILLYRSPNKTQKEFEYYTAKLNLT